MQYPKVPKLTLELRISVRLLRVTRKRPLSFMIGAEMVVIIRRIDETSSRKTPTLL